MGFVFYQAIFSYARDFFEAQNGKPATLTISLSVGFYSMIFGSDHPKKCKKMDWISWQELAASEAQGKAESHRVEVEGHEAERYLWRCLVFFVKKL